MNYEEALEIMRSGKKVKLPEWKGYWYMEHGKVLVVTRDGRVLDTPHYSEYFGRTDFEETEGTFDYGMALNFLKNGFLVQRSGWNGKGMFVFMRPADNLDVDFIDKVKSLPESVKSYFRQDSFHTSQQFVRFTSYLCMLNAQGEIMNGWAATQTDTLAEDWKLFEI